MVRLFAAVAALVLWAGPAAAQTFPKFSGFVVDSANVLSPETEAALTQKLDALQRDTKRQLVVATVADTGGRPIEDYAIRMAREWGVGLREVDNGAILLVAPGNGAGQRGPRLEVGRGLEPILTDAFAESVVEGQMTPILKANGDVDRAMTVGTDAIVAQLRASPEEAQARLDAAVKDYDRTHRRAGSGGGFPIGLVVIGVMLAFFILPLVFRRRERIGPWGKRYKRRGGFDAGDAGVLLWTIGNAIADSSRHSRGGGGFGGFGGGGGGGWGGGGFGGGGGGGFGGGGASGSW